MTTNLRFLLATLFAFQAIVVSAQQAFPEGATWHYHYFGGFQLGTFIDQEQGHDILTLSEADTLIEGQVCQRIERERIVWTHPSTGDPDAEWSGPFTEFKSDQFVYADGDIVYYYHDGEFKTLFNFSAEIGDSWLSTVINAEDVQYTSAVDYTTTIVDKGTVMIDGSPRVFIDLEGERLDGEYIGPIGRAIQGIGLISGPATGYLFPDHSPVIGHGTLTELEWFSFSCFESAVDALYQEGDDCQFSPVGIEDLDIVRLELYPNPVSDILNLEALDEGILQIELLDSQGRVIRSQKVTNGSMQVDMTLLTAGVYHLLIDTTEGLKRWASPILKK